MSRPPGTLHFSSSRRQSPHLAINSFVRLPTRSPLPRGVTVHVARPARTIPVYYARDRLRGSLLRPMCQIAGPIYSELVLPSFSAIPKTSGQSVTRIPLCVVRGRSLPIAFLVFYSDLFRVPNS